MIKKLIDMSWISASDPPVPDNWKPDDDITAEIGGSEGSAYVMLKLNSPTARAVLDHPVYRQTFTFKALVYTGLSLNLPTGLIAPKEAAMSVRPAMEKLAKQKAARMQAGDSDGDIDSGCPMCRTAALLYTLYPCFHLALCKACAADTIGKACPICRATCIRTLRVDEA
jgi:hypothetical protein